MDINTDADVFYEKSQYLQHSPALLNLWSTKVITLSEKVSLLPDSPQKDDIKDRLQIAGEYILHLYKLKRYTSPRYAFCAADLTFSVWQNIRNKGSDKAYMKFLRVPKFIFNIIAEGVRLHDEHRDPVKAANMVGRKPKLDYKDITALALRYYQVQTIDQLAIEFGAVSSIIYRDLSDARDIIFQVLKSIPEGECRYPTGEEAEEMYTAITIQHGKPPSNITIPYYIGLVLDGTFTPGKQPSNKIEGDIRYSLHKGSGLNHIFMIDYWGCVVDYEICRLGSCHDSRAAINVFRRHKDIRYNPAKVGVVVDSGFRRYAVTPWVVEDEEDYFSTDPPASVYMPLSLTDQRLYGNFEPHERKFSDWLRSIRQSIELFNGNLKQTFPFLNKKIGLEDEKLFGRDLEAVIFLWNMRSRLIGYNQVSSIYKKNVDARFEELLRTKEFDAYIALCAEYYFDDTSMDDE